jgi:hypothetical protein
MIDSRGTDAAADGVRTPGEKLKSKKYYRDGVPFIFSFSLALRCAFLLGRKPCARAAVTRSLYTALRAGDIIYRRDADFFPGN